MCYVCVQESVKISFSYLNGPVQMPTEGQGWTKVPNCLFGLLNSARPFFVWTQSNFLGVIIS